MHVIASAAHSLTADLVLTGTGLLRGWQAGVLVPFVVDPALAVFGIQIDTHFPDGMLVDKRLNVYKRAYVF